MRETIKVSLSNVDGILGEIEKRVARAQERGKELSRRLAEIGVEVASVKFSTAFYDGTNDVTVSAHENGNGYVISADGEAVCFIEFGAGIYYNSVGSYKGNRPPGIVEIGEYGNKHGGELTKDGKPKGWGYQDETGRWRHTYGNPAAMPMYYAASEMRLKIAEIAREVFAS